MYTGDIHCGFQLTDAGILDYLSECEATLFFNHCIELFFCINLCFTSVRKTIIKRNLERYLAYIYQSQSILRAAKAGTQEK